MNKKVNDLKEALEKISKKEINIMEVCGTHTMALARNAIRTLLPSNINIISGPGCPVCVTSASDIHTAITLAKKPEFLIATFGDMLKVPSDGDSLINYGSSVKIVYSPLDSLKMAKENPDKEIVFLGIGFETTTPLIAQTIIQAKEEGLKNFSVISMHKTVPDALVAIASAPNNKIHGLILPGHVSAVTGRQYWDFVKPTGISGIVAGFEPVDVMEAIYLLTKYINDGETEIVNNYKRVVTEEGNKIAMSTLFEVFEACDSEWRGIGVIPNSGLKLKKSFSEFDAVKKFNIEVKQIDDAPGCICGEILMGHKKPHHCKFYGRGCTPSNPIGPCMVSSEGTCAAYFKYNI